jgi:hypothetical protein
MSNEPDSPDVIGCPRCLHIFTCATYFNTSEDLSYQWCVSCGAKQIYHLGKLPMVVEDNEKFYLIGDNDVFVTGPYSTLEEAHDNLWAWFNRKNAHDKKTQKARRKGHLWLAASEGAILKEDVQEKCPQESAQEGIEGKENQTPSPKGSTREKRPKK